ncbi:hypothetical protein AbraIFM66950_002772 [Aspergillus brasiliensis]|nr:hypothetical protein AbraIFM66950_002772 [Aspergillus brasiliensis]
MTQTTSRVLGNSLRFASDKQSASRYAFERLQTVRSTDIDLGDGSCITGPRRLPVLSLREAEISQQ